MAARVPARLVAEQGPTIAAMAAGGARSMVPARLRAGGVGRVRHTEVSAGSDRLLDAYAAWSGAPPQRYAGLVPPHSFSRWALPMIARLTSSAPYPLLEVVNQGVRLRVDAPLPRGVPITLRGELVEAAERDGRVRIHTRVTASTEASPDALIIDTFAAVITRMRRPRPRGGGGHDEPPTTSIGTWSADRHDGVRFFALTGDFNPIHTLEPVARRTRFGGCILHGFGNLARTYEVIRDAGWEPRDLDVRFTAPNHLPSSELTVELGDRPDHEGRRTLRVRSPEDTAVLAGTLQAEKVTDPTITDATQPDERATR